MSMSTLIGMFFGLILFLGSIALSTDNVLSFLDPASFIMVAGGTLAAAFMNFQYYYVKQGLKAIGYMFRKPEATRDTMNREVMQLIKWGYIVQTKGVPALEGETKGVSFANPLLKFGGEIVSASHKPEEIRAMMETAVENTFERDMVVVDVLKNMASTAPAFGMIGTLVGLVIMLQNMGSDMSKLGTGMAVALLTTLYGIVLARLLLLPAALNLEQKISIVRFRNCLIAEGMVMLSERTSPRAMQDRLNSFLDPALHFSIDRQMR